MKKIFVLVALALAAFPAAKARAYASSPNYEEYTSTIISANQPAILAKISTGVVTFGYYQVLSTGTTEDSFNIYDTYLSTNQANIVAVSSGMPVTAVGTYPLDLTCSTGAFVTLDSPANRTSIRVRFNYRRQQKY